MSLAFYGQWVITGVVEEKNNRVVELILSTVRPRHLLAGKVIGIGLLGFAQLALVAGLAAVLLAAGVFDAPAELGGDIALVIPWFALGFALYAVAYAAAGALASRQQNADTAGQPVTYTLLAVYFAGYVALSSDPNGLLANVLTVFPLTAPLVLPARSALVGVPLWEHALAVVLVLGSIYALVRFAGRVYAPRAAPRRPAPRPPRRLAAHAPVMNQCRSPSSCSVALLRAMFTAFDKRHWAFSRTKCQPRRRKPREWNRPGKIGRPASALGSTVRRSNRGQLVAPAACVARLQRSVCERAQRVQDDGDVDHLLQQGSLHGREVAGCGEAHGDQRERDAGEDALACDVERAPADPDRVGDAVDAVDEDRRRRRSREETVAPAEPMAMPTSASASAGASLMPSPTMTTPRSSGRSRSARTTSSFSSGVWSA